MEIDWTDGTQQVTEHFTVNDALMLHNWNRLATEADGVNFNTLTSLCNTLEKVRDILGCPMNIHCMYRSPAYNQAQEIIPNDVHSLSMAADFDCNGNMTIQEVQAKLEPLLEELGIRMERNTQTWVHLDIHPVGNARYFYP